MVFNWRGGAGTGRAADDIGFEYLVEVEGCFFDAVLCEPADSVGGLGVAIFDCYGYIFSGVGDVEQAGDGGHVCVRFGGEDEFSDGVAEVFGFAAFADDAVVEDGDVVGDGFDLVEQVAGEEDGDAAALQEVDDVAEEVFSGDGVQAERGVVEDDQFGMVAEGQQEGEAGVLAFGEGLDFGILREAEQVGEFIGEGRVPIRIEACDPFDDPADGHPAVHLLVFGHVADALADVEGVFEAVQAEHGRRAGGGFLQTEERLDQRGFAGAIAAEKAEDGAFGDFQIDAGKDFFAAVGKMQVFNFDCGIGHRYALSFGIF